MVVVLANSGQELVGTIVETVAVLIGSENAELEVEVIIVVVAVVVAVDNVEIV